MDIWYNKLLIQFPIEEVLFVQHKQFEMMSYYASL